MASDYVMIYISPSFIWTLNEMFKTISPATMASPKLTFTFKLYLFYNYIHVTTYQGPLLLAQNKEFLWPYYGQEAEYPEKIHMSHMVNLHSALKTVCGNSYLPFYEL